ncbi:MAG TPA: DUF3592 domain-containing protein [Tepidisphaeraceae bacterium]|nr:DUF3592 domain-containing protein [Tepidisphaeraceae bacterium]
MIAIYIVLGMAVVGALFLVAFYHQKNLKMTSQTTGEVVRSEQREVRDEKERRDETVVVCRFTVNGHTHTIERIVRGRWASRYPVGRSLTVFYNPADPGMARVDIK